MGKKTTPTVEELEVERSDLGKELEFLYSEALSKYWEKLALPLLREKIDSGEPQEAHPKVTWLMDQARARGWESVAEEFRKRG